MVLPRSLRIATYVAAGLALVGLLAWSGSTFLAKVEPRVIEMHPAIRQLEAKEVWDLAEVVAIVTPTGSSSVHWNSRDNKEWKADAVSQAALIVRDDQFLIKEVRKGQLPETELTIRGVGGTVDGVTLVYEGQESWKVGSDYLVFLRKAKTPTKEGFETAWTEVDIGQSSFERDGSGTWVSDATVRLSDNEVSRLASE